MGSGRDASLRPHSSDCRAIRGKQGAARIEQGQLIRDQAHVPGEFQPIAVIDRVTRGQQDRREGRAFESSVIEELIDQAFDPDIQRRRKHQVALHRGAARLANRVRERWPGFTVVQFGLRIEFKLGIGPGRGPVVSGDEHGLAGLRRLAGW